MASARSPGGQRARETLGVPSLLVALMAAVGLVVAAVVVVAVSESAAVRVGAVVILVVADAALIAHVFRTLAKTGAAPEVAGAPPPAASPMRLGEGVNADRLRSASITALQDAHALQRGTRHFAQAAASMVRTEENGGRAASEPSELFDAQRDCAARHTELLEERLRTLGYHPSRAGDDEAIIAASLYERLMVRSVATNARHAFGLAWLGIATYTLLEHLAATSGDDSTRSLAAECRQDLYSLAGRWEASWDSVLDLDTSGAKRDAKQTMLDLLEEVHDMEAMRASLLAVTTAQARGAGIASGAEDAGLPRLLALVDQERQAAAHNRDLLRERLRALHRHPSRLHAFETFAATRASALVEHIRTYKLVRDLRDLLAADQLEAASYELLARAAERAGDRETARLAHELRAKVGTAADLVTAELDSALEVALLAE